MRLLLHVTGIAILVFFIASFFIGLELDPAFTDIAHSPYGLFSYFIITALTAFIPSLTTLPVVATATFIWGPWVAGIFAILGWTIGSIIEYSIAYFAISSFGSKIDNSALDRKIERVRESAKLWPMIVARLFAPPFVFGLVRINAKKFILVSFLVYIPLAAAGVTGGQLLKGQLEEARNLLIGGSLILFIFAIDFLFSKKKVN